MRYALPEGVDWISTVVPDDCDDVQGSSELDDTIRRQHPHPGTTRPLSRVHGWHLWSPQPTKFRRC